MPRAQFLISFVINSSKYIPSSLLIFKSLLNQPFLSDPIIAYNKIIKKKTVDKLIKNGIEVVLSIATQTSEWTRPEFIADAIAQRAAPVIQNSKTVLPASTVEVCIR
jgi:hypothetical protein